MWPENETAFDLFCELQTQWRVGPGGAIGLDYGVLFARMVRLKLPDDEYEATFHAIRAMEAETLAVMYEKP